MLNINIMQFGFERLIVWQKARKLVGRVYDLIKILPNEERFGLIDQLRRASVSIVSNLAEGSGRMSLKEKIHFCEISYGSLMEVTCQLLIAQDLGYLSEEHNQSIRPQIEELEKLLRGYHKFLVSKSKEKQ